MKLIKISQKEMCNSLVKKKKKKKKKKKNFKPLIKKKKKKKQKLNITIYPSKENERNHQRHVEYQIYLRSIEIKKIKHHVQIPL